MTLNVTILTPAIIYQSADFRLTNSDTGKLITDRSAKSVVLTYSTWIGFVTYTGLGSWRGQDLSDFVAGWLADGKQRSMAEVADHLADEGTKLLTTVQRQTRRQFKHTFTLAGFEAGYVRAFTISNFEDCFGTVRESPDQQLTVTTRKLRGGSKATVIVTGCKPAVPTSDRRQLGALAAKYSTDGGRIRRRMEALNTKAANPSVSKGLISEDCVVLSFRSDGSGVLQLSNEAAEVPRQFPHIINGMNVTQAMHNALRSVGIDLTQARIVQGAFASSHSSGPTTGTPVPCPFAVAEDDPTSGYKIHEITAPDFNTMSPNDINDSGQVVGTGQQPQTQTNIPWMVQNGQLAHLNYTGLALAVNKHGQVAGMLQSAQGERATVYEGDLLIELPLFHGEPGVFVVTDSYARAINADGTVAGSVRSRTEERGRPNTRAAVLRSGQPPTVLIELQAEFGSSAVDINERGQVLVLASPANFARSILWTPQDGSWSYIGNHAANVFPIAITDEGLVLGKAQINQAKPRVVICHPGGDWEPLGIDDGWEAIDINNQGEVIGWAWVNQLQRPWLRLASGQIIWLPYIMEHHTTTKAINNYGQIIGSAVADHGQHAVIWQRF